MKHRLTILMNNVEVLGENFMDPLTIADGVADGTSMNDISNKADASDGIGLTQATLLCPDDATRELYEALDGSRYAIVSSETL